MTIHQNKNNFYYLFLSYFLLFGLINLEYFHLSLNYLYDDSYINRLKFLRSLIPFWIILQFLIIKFKSLYFNLCNYFVFFLLNV